MLSHYDAVVWEKGNDYVTRRPGQPGATGQARVAIESSSRPPLPERGRQAVLHGPERGQQYADGFEFRNFGFPEPDECDRGRWCAGADPEAVDGCITPDNDFQQYYLGAYIYVGGGNAHDEDGNPLPMHGRAGSPFGSSSFDVQRPRTRRTTRRTRPRSR